MLDRLETEELFCHRNIFKMFNSFADTQVALVYISGLGQGGITCGAIEEASISSKTIDKHVIINYREKMPHLHAFATKMMYDKKDFSFV